MTVGVLSAWIAAVLLAQLALFMGIGFGRHWSRYRQLQDSVANGETITAPSMPEPVSGPAWQGVRSFRVAAVRPEAPDNSICSFLLAPEDGKQLPPFLPGQYLSFHLSLPATEGRSEKVIRCYSLSDAPRPDHYRVSIKRIASPPGRVSNHFHDHVAVGDLLQVGAPAGHFYLDAGSGPVVLIAGGIGITPMMSMLAWSLREQPAREIWLFLGVRNSREQPMKAALETLAADHANFRLHVCYSAPLPDDLPTRDFQHAGRVSVELLRQLLPLKPYHFYLCGPGAMMETIVRDLDAWGVPEDRVHYEAFGPASVRRRPTTPATAPAAEIVVDFARTGKSVAWKGDAGSLLELAEGAGIAVASGCRAGSCGTCQTVIRSGEVTYLQKPDFDPEPGSCLLCVCAPKTSLTLEA